MSHRYAGRIKFHARAPKMTLRLFGALRHPPLPQLQHFSLWETFPT